MKFVLVLLALLLLAPLSSHAQRKSTHRQPIIDVHMHGYSPEKFTSPSANPVTGKPLSVVNGEEHMKATLAAMKRYNIVKGVVSNLTGTLEDLYQWHAADPARIIVSPYMEGNPSHPLPDISLLRSEYATNRLGAMGEIGAQYAGLSLADPKFEPYLALAEQLDIPVGVHTGLSLPGISYDPCCRNFRTLYGNPQLVEEVLNRHPKLRLYLMHGGWPYTQETIAVMLVYPQVYADLAVINWIIPREEFHAHLHSLMRAGLGKRLMFGSDQMEWPEAIGMAIDGLESARFLTEEQKRDIFCNNAARFFRWEGKNNPCRWR